MFENVKFLVVGAGFSGSVIAERIANVLNESVLVIDSKLHVGGNSYSETDSASGIECHRYGSHIFHTSSESVWNYIRRFTEFNSYQHKVLTTYQGHVYQMPINLKTVNDYYGLNLKPWEAQEFIRKEAEMAGSLGLKLMRNPLFAVFSGIFSMLIYGGLLGLLISIFVRRPADPFGGGTSAE